VLTPRHLASSDDVGFPMLDVSDVPNPPALKKTWAPATLSEGLPAPMSMVDADLEEVAQKILT